MNWQDFTPIENVDLSGAEIYVENRLVGVSLGNISFTYEPTIKQYFGGYPAQLRGSEIVAESLRADIQFLEFTPSNIALAFPAGTITSTSTKETINLRSTTQPIIWQNVLIVKDNPGNGMRYTFKINSAQVTSSFSVSYSHDSSEFVGVNITLEARVATVGSSLGEITIEEY